tara:strand:+ start:1864 stop:2316 length:453 start_codon:yes stop_codon:yes gene_type:complete
MDLNALYVARSCEWVVADYGEEQLYSALTVVLWMEMGLVMLNNLNAVLIAGRHEVWLGDELVTDAVWPDTLDAQHIHDHEWLERSALGWLNNLPNKPIRINMVITGLGQAVVAFLKMFDVVYMHRQAPIELNCLFYNRETESYTFSPWDR